MVLANAPLHLVGIKVRPPRAFALCKGKITFDRCTFTPVSGAKVLLPNPPFQEKSSPQMNI